MTENQPIDHVYNWVWQLGAISGTIPPFCVEISLMDDTKFFLHSVQDQNEATQSLVLNFWDFRAFEEEDFNELKARLADLEDRSKLDAPEAVHPKLTIAIMRLHLGYINYAIEWNDRLLPIEERKQMMGLVPSSSAEPG